MTILFKTIIENISIKKQFPVYIKEKKKKKEIKSCVFRGKNNIFLDEDNKTSFSDENILFRPSHSV